MLLPYFGRINLRKKCICIKPITQKEAFYLKEHGHDNCVQKVKWHSSYYVVEDADKLLKQGDEMFSKLLKKLDEDEEEKGLDNKLFKVLKNNAGKIEGIIRYGALTALEKYRKSVTVYSYFKKVK